MAAQTVSRGHQQVPGHGTPVGFQTFFPSAPSLAPSVPDEDSPQPSQDAPDATDAAVAKAEELDVDLSEVDGSGADGRITVEDVESAAERDSA